MRSKVICVTTAAALEEISDNFCSQDVPRKKTIAKTMEKTKCKKWQPFPEMGEFDNSSAGSQDGGDLEEELQPVQLNTQAICVESIAVICAIIAKISSF